MSKLRRIHKVFVVLVVAVVALLLFSEYTMPPLLQKLPRQIPASEYANSLGSNVSFELSGPFANSSYLAWILGPNQYLPTMIDFGVTVFVVETGQNSSFGESTISITKAVYESPATSNVTEYSISPWVFNNESHGLIIGFNRLWRENGTNSAVVNITFVEQSVIGPIHLPGQSLTVSLPIRFNTTQ